MVSAFEEGLQVHSQVLRSGFSSCPFVETALVNFYAKCEQIGLAQKMFDEISDKNLIAWSTMISGYSKSGMAKEALGLFRDMQMRGVFPDEVTLLSVISACSVSGALDIGRWVHTFVEKQSMKCDLELSTAFVNMYAKCGCIERAKEVFDEMLVRDTKAWSTMIVGLAIHGLVEDALETFRRMEEAKVTPNHVTFLGVLSACAHSGLVSEGRRFWSNMLESKIEPSIEHYGCMVDLLCRAGRVEEAHAFAETMPISPNPVIWRTLLSSCRRTRMLEKGHIIAQHLLELEPNNGDNYILLSNFYASGLQWEKMMVTRKKMKERGINVIPGCSSIEVDGFVHEFVTGDWSHAEEKAIREFLRDIVERIRDEGHEPLVSNILHNVSKDEKQYNLFEHSERLAIAYGLMKTKSPIVIRIVKNLRACEDCHEVTKIISKVYGREIVVRDRVRFHKFVDGTCSCKDYW